MWIALRPLMPSRRPRLSRGLFTCHRWVCSWSSISCQWGIQLRPFPEVQRLSPHSGSSLIPSVWSLWFCTSHLVSALPWVWKEVGDKAKFLYTNYWVIRNQGKTVVESRYLQSWRPYKLVNIRSWSLRGPNLVFFCLAWKHKWLQG